METSPYHSRRTDCATSVCYSAQGQALLLSRHKCLCSSLHLPQLRVSSLLFFYLLQDGCFSRDLLAFLLGRRRILEEIVSSANVRREWNEETLKFLIGLCEEKYWEYNRKPFKKANWKYFAGKVNK